MSTSERAAKARRSLEAGKERRALAEAWDTAQLALRRGDRDGVSAMRDLAQEIAERSNGSRAERARQLAVYCQHCLDGVGGGVKAQSILSRLFGGRRKPDKVCPDCAEEIKHDARVCRYCGYRYDGGGASEPPG
jgi:Uncharacterised protein family UPF0547